MNTKGVAFLTIAATLAAISVTVFLIEWESSPLIILFVVLGLLAIVSNLILVSKLFAMYQKSKRQVQSVLYEKECMADAMENIRKEMQQQNLQLSEFEVIRKNLQKFKSFPDIQSDSSINEDFGKIISFLLNFPGKRTIAAPGRTKNRTAHNSKPILVGFVQHSMEKAE